MAREYVGAGETAWFCDVTRCKAQIDVVESDEYGKIVKADCGGGHAECCDVDLCAAHMHSEAGCNRFWATLDAAAVPQTDAVAC
jgi:hypothetical protein